ncbi:MAG: prepilin-type N-terminal cleavage/methylation domain-containing protein [Firmicutes bacterium]|jgi:prepilin-type N-terminal cleavage/methylation domain-containing protein|nr:prepilin-type N-terminal cleavage/methylation domain-containing protein [Bacillota bacterium]
MKLQQGFTFMEVMVATLILLIVVGAFGGMLVAYQASMKNLGIRTQAQFELQSLMETVLGGADDFLEKEHVSILNEFDQGNPFEIRFPDTTMRFTGYEVKVTNSYKDSQGKMNVVSYTTFILNGVEE